MTMERYESHYEKYVKRSLDLMGACVAMTLLAIPMGVIACFVRINLGKPVLYSAVRIGKNEKPFIMYKFRTMINAYDEEGNPLHEALRMTSFGNKLRSTSLDELPELFNVLKGDMSFIGPRPLPPEYLPYYTEEEARRHSCRGGISGLAQVEGRTALTWEERFAYDNEYVDKLSFHMDCLIFFRTIKKVFAHDDIGEPETGVNVSLNEIRQIQRPEKVMTNEE